MGGAAKPKLGEKHNIALTFKAPYLSTRLQSRCVNVSLLEGCEMSPPARPRRIIDRWVGDAGRFYAPRAVYAP